MNQEEFAPNEHVIWIRNGYTHTPVKISATFLVSVNEDQARIIVDEQRFGNKRHTVYKKYLRKAK